MRLLCVILAVALILPPMSFVRADTSPSPVGLDDLKERFPSARFVEVSLAEYELLLASADRHAVVIVDTPQGADDPPDSFTPADIDRRHWPPEGSIAPAQTRIPTSSDRSRDISVAVYGQGTGSIATDDVAIILYVLVGVVVIGAALIYGGVIFYEMITGEEEYAYWSDVGAGAWFWGGSGRRGGMYGGRGSIGLIDDEVRVGLILETGYLDGRFRFRDKEEFLSVSGAYGLLGPTVQWAFTKGDNPVSVDFEILTGYSSADHVGLMSRALAGVSWGMGRTFRMGVMAGSTYAKIRETEGPLNTKSDFNLTAGGWIGVRY